MSNTRNKWNPDSGPWNWEADHVAFARVQTAATSGKAGGTLVNFAANFFEDSSGSAVDLSDSRLKALIVDNSENGSAAAMQFNDAADATDAIKKTIAAGSAAQLFNFDTRADLRLHDGAGGAVWVTLIAFYDKVS